MRTDWVVCWLKGGVFIVLLLGGGLCSADELPAQKVHREGFSVASEEIRQLILQFYDYDVSQPLEARTVEDWTTKMGRHEKVVFTTHGGERVPGQLVFPLDAEGPLPGVLLIHGLGSSKDYWWREDREALARGLLAGGVAVLTIDLELHGERSVENDYQNPVFLTMGDSRLVRSRDMLIQSTIDARLALTMLRDRPDIDGGRLGVVGYSMGAMVTAFLGVLEPELFAVVSCAIPTTQQPTPIDPFQFAPRIAMPWLLQVGREDWVSSPDDARRLLGLSEAPGRELKFYESCHTLPPEFASEAAGWILQQISE